MRVVLVYFFMLVLFFSCSTINKASHCKENISFKKDFFSSIDIIEEFTRKRIDSSELNIPKLNVIDFPNFKKLKNKREYTEAIYFLNDYVTISDSILNYFFEYSDLDMFYRDKKNWLNWYEENRCKKLK